VRAIVDIKKPYREYIKLRQHNKNLSREKFFDKYAKAGEIQ
jgi:hypothetical protein